ncbi:MAG: barstar family protein [Gordonia sp. (in: high G+C Gram-positive bacteria)]
MSENTEYEPISLSRFFSGARGYGPAVGLWLDHRPATDRATATPANSEISSSEISSGEIDIREIDAAHMRTLDGLYDSYAAAWDFPDYFGHNKDALNDCMRNLHEKNATWPTDEARPATGPGGYLTVINNADQLLADAPTQLRWFAEALALYRDHYRDVASPRATFATLLIAPPALLSAVTLRWLRAGIPIAHVSG